MTLGGPPLPDRNSDVRGVLEPARMGPWDRVDGERPQDLGWIGVAGSGVWTSLHPETLLDDHPDVAAEVDRFRRGFAELTEFDTCFRQDLVHEMAAARARARERAEQERGRR